MITKTLTLSEAQWESLEIPPGETVEQLLDEIAAALSQTDPWSSDCIAAVKTVEQRQARKSLKRLREMLVGFRKLIPGETIVQGDEVEISGRWWPTKDAGRFVKADDLPYRRKRVVRHD